MNLAGNQAKQLFKSLRTGASPSAVGLWAAATAVDQMRKRATRPDKELLVSKKLKPGESYVIRMPGSDEGSLAESLSPGTRVAEIEAGDEGSIASQLFSAATELIGAASEDAAEAPSLSRRQRRKESKAPSDEPAPKLNRRQRRKVSLVEAAAPTEPSNGSLASTLVDAAASFMGSGESAPENSPVKESRRKARRSDRLASLDDVEFDRDALPRRRRRKLNRTERRARKRPSRKRVRRARKQQNGAARTYARAERRSEPSRRKRRKIRAAERELEYRQAKVEKRSTRRRRRRLKQAEKQLAKLA